MVTKPDATGFSVLAAGDTVAAVKLSGVPSVAVTVPIGAVAVRAVVTQSNWVTVRGTGEDYVVHAQSTIDGFWYEFSSKTGKYTSSTDKPPVTPKVPSSKDPVDNSVKNPDGTPIRVPGDPVTVIDGTPGGGTPGGGGGTGGSSSAAITLVQAYDNDKGESGLYASNGTSLKLLQRAVQSNDINFQYSHPTYKGKTYLVMYTTDYPRTLKLWSTDGNTMAAVDNISPAPGTGIIVYNNLLYFAANSNDGAGYELSSYDGTTLTRVEDINPGAGDSGAPDLTIYNNHLIFSGYNGTSNGLYSYDGSSITTTISTIFAPSRTTDTLGTKRLVSFNGKLIYTNNIDSSHQQLFEYDGTISHQITNQATTGPLGATFSNYTIMGGVLYFRAGEITPNTSYDWFLYKYDGSTATKVTSGSVDSYLQGVQPGMAELNGTLYLISNASLWSYNPVDGLVKVDAATLDNGLYSMSGAVFIGVSNGKLYLALTDRNEDSQVYSYDGISVTKMSNVPFGMASTYPPPAVSGSYVYFQAYDSNYHQWLYSTDGTTDTKLGMIENSLVLGLVGS